jgi:signal transduction histidine kinase
MFGRDAPLRALLIFMVLAAVGVSVINADHAEPAVRWQLTIVGLFYLAVLLFLIRAESVRKTSSGLILGFAVQLIFTGWISFLLVQLGVLGVAILLFMPVIGMAVADLDARGLIIVLTLCAVQFLGAAWLIGGNSLLPEAALGFAAGAAFVIMLIRLVIREQQANNEVARLNERLWQQLLNAEALSSERERVRLAREIHDGLGHSLTTAAVQLEVAELELATNQDAARQALARARECISRGLKDVRASVSNLRQSPLEGRSLAEAVADLAAEIEREGLQVEYQCHGLPRKLPEPLSMEVYRAAQEGLSNVLKHSGASHARVQLDFRSPRFTFLLIEDNGGGGSDRHAEGFGLKGLQERAKLVDGVFEAGSRPDQGFRLRFGVPA